MQKPSVFAAYAALTTSALVWGGSIVGQKLALGAFSAVETSLLRGFGALVILIPLWWWSEGGRTTWTARDLRPRVASKSNCCRRAPPSWSTGYKPKATIPRPTSS